MIHDSITQPSITRMGSVFHFRRTKKAAAKRYSFTASGKVKYKKMNLRHILTKKTTKRKMKARKSKANHGSKPNAGR